MKMNSIDYFDLFLVIEKYITTRNISLKVVREKYKNLGHSEKRFRWDVLHAAFAQEGKPGEKTRWYDSVYKYCNDDHIDTALKRIIKHFDEKENRG